jgi:hypothetical protein
MVRVDIAELFSVSSSRNTSRGPDSRSVLLRTPASAVYDAAWRGRCPNIEIIEVAGRHHSVLDNENFPFLHKALVTAFAQ